MDQQQITNTITTIKQYELDVEDTKTKLKTAKEMLADHVEQKQEWLDLESLKDQVKAAKAALDQSLQGDAEYNNQMENIGQLKEKLKDQKQILSDYVVGYYGLTKERQIQTDANGDARELVIKGRLGKKQKYQTNLFNRSIEGNEQA